MLYLNISDFINITHQRILRDASYLPPMCSLSFIHAEDTALKSKTNKSDEILNEPDLRLNRHTRAPPAAP